MKTDRYTGIVCKEFCRFYKEGREEMTCGSYNFLAEKFTPEALGAKIKVMTKKADFSRDEEIKKLICERCAFFADGCDFRKGLDSPPCGGYAIIEGLLSQHLKT